MRHSVARVRKHIMSSKWHSAAVKLSKLFAPFVLDITGWFNRSLRGGNLSRNIRDLLQGSRIQVVPYHSNFADNLFGCHPIVVVTLADLVPFFKLLIFQNNWNKRNPFARFNFSHSNNFLSTLSHLSSKDTFNNASSFDNTNLMPLFGHPERVINLAPISGFSPPQGSDTQSDLGSIQHTRPIDQLSISHCYQRPRSDSALQQCLQCNFPINRPLRTHDRDDLIRRGSAPGLRNPRRSPNGLTTQNPN